MPHRAFPIVCLTERSLGSIPYEAFPIICLPKCSLLYASQSVPSGTFPMKRSPLCASHSVSHCRPQSRWSVPDEAFPIVCLTERSFCSVPYEAFPIVGLTERSLL